MRFFRKNLNSDFIRICRIQYSSKLKNQNTYPNHHYKIKFNFDEIYSPGILKNTKERILDLYISSNGEIIFTNDNSIYMKKTENENNSFIDIGYQVNNYYTNINVEIESQNSGSIKFYCDNANISEYSRMNFFGTNLNYMLNKGHVTTYLGNGQNINLVTVNDVCEITNMRTGKTTYIQPDNVIRNLNTDFTLSISSSNDFGRVINILANANIDLLIKSL